jgi:hypothetical protein
MRIKSRTRPVIILSSLIIISVMVLTMLGFYAYLEWKEKNMRNTYYEDLYKLNAQIFKKHISVILKAKFETEGYLKETPVVYGSIKNNLDKKIYSLKMKVRLFDQDQKVLYLDTFLPIGYDLETFIDIRELIFNTENFLGEGDSISFEHQIKNCPPKVLDYFKSQLKFAKSENVKYINLKYDIEGLELR